MPKTTDGFNPYAAGKKIYGGGRSAPNIGPVDKQGYRERDRKSRTMRTAMLRRMQKGQNREFSSANYLRRAR